MNWLAWEMFGVKDHKKILEEGDIPETHYISSSLRAFSFVILGRICQTSGTNRIGWCDIFVGESYVVIFREQFVKHGELIGSDGATLC